MGSNEWFRKEMKGIGISLEGNEWDSLWYMPPEDKKRILIPDTTMTPFMYHYHQRIPRLLKNDELLISKAFIITLIWAYNGNREELLNIGLDFTDTADQFMQHYMSVL